MKYENVIRGDQGVCYTGGAMKILGCLSRMSNGILRGDMAIDTLRSSRDKAKLKS